jgi:hypothetical protein
MKGGPVASMTAMARGTRERLTTYRRLTAKDNESLDSQQAESRLQGAETALSVRSQIMSQAAA